MMWATSCLPCAGGLSHDGTLYAAPFYGESSMIMYRTDLMEAGWSGNARGTHMGVYS